MISSLQAGTSWYPHPPGAPPTPTGLTVSPPGCRGRHGVPLQAQDMKFIPAFPGHLSWIAGSGGSPCHVVRSLKQPRERPWCRGTEASHLGPRESRLGWILQPSPAFRRCSPTDFPMGRLPTESWDPTEEPVRTSLFPNSYPQKTYNTCGCSKPLHFGTLLSTNR